MSKFFQQESIHLKSYLQKYKEQLLPNMQIQNIQATVLTLDQLDQAAEILKNNQLVAFPTETVYGLGANALNEQALLKIYATKRRPLSDPIIVHVLDQQQALELVDITKQEKQIFEFLTNHFWPGPLTVILKANLNKLPLVVTAGTGYVGVRSPREETARKLIRKTGLPIGAPSANLFGHVSPTESFHVFNDFYDQKVAIIDGDRCEYGLESTVIKIQNQKLLVLRQGSLTQLKLREKLKQNNQMNSLQVEIVKLVKKQTQNQESPGQLFKHYSPNIPCYFLTKNNNKQSPSIQSQKIQDLENTVFLSFSSQFNEFASVCTYIKVGQYFKQQFSSKQSEIQQQILQLDLFCSIQEKKKMKEVYFLLRKAENTGKKLIVIGWDEKKQGPIWDKIARSTENKEAYIFGNIFYSS